MWLEHAWFVGGKARLGHIWGTGVQGQRVTDHIPCGEEANGALREAVCNGELHSGCYVDSRFAEEDKQEKGTAAILQPRDGCNSAYVNSITNLLIDIFKYMRHKVYHSNHFK